MTQRLRITYGRDGSARYLSHLEMMRAWERTLRRAGWSVAYSQGFNPHAKLSFAAPLPVGVASTGELLDVTLEAERPVIEARADLVAHVPGDFVVVSVEDISLEAPPLPRSLRAAEYVARCRVQAVEPLVAEARRVMDATTLRRQRLKESKSVEYDLRPMIREIGVEDDEGTAVITMVLRADAQGAGRADEVLRELGLEPAECAITRTRLVLSEAGE